MKGEQVMKKSICFFTILLAVALFSSQLLAEGTCTKDSVVSAVDEAVALLEQEGEAGLEKVGKIRFCGDNYLFVNDLKGKTLMHLKPHLIGKVLIGLKDDTGKRFFSDFTKMAKTSQAAGGDEKIYNGKGWVPYRWPKPGEDAFSSKLSYIRGCAMGGKSVYVGAGIYE